MSYKRAWSLVQALNEGWGAPLVETTRGGAGQGGASLTDDGRFVLERYRAMQAATRTAFRRLRWASVLSAVKGRCAPTMTSGLRARTVRLRK